MQRHIDPSAVARGRSPWPLVFKWCSASREARVHSKHLARLMASFLYARRIISKVSAPDLPSFTQNSMFALCSSFTSMLESQMWRHTWWQTLVLCNSQCSHSDATWHAEWWRSLLPSTAHSFMYCHRLAVYGTSLKTFWYTLVLTLWFHIL
jgi:hypothetical protein